MIPITRPRRQRCIQARDTCMSSLASVGRSRPPLGHEIVAGSPSNPHLQQRQPRARCPRPPLHGQQSYRPDFGVLHQWGREVLNIEMVVGLCASPRVIAVSCSRSRLQPLGSAFCLLLFVLEPVLFCFGQAYLGIASLQVRDYKSP